MYKGCLLFLMVMGLVVAASYGIAAICHVPVLPVSMGVVLGAVFAILLGIIMEWAGWAEPPHPRGFRKERDDGEE